jgi:hypothetical protein
MKEVKNQVAFAGSQEVGGSNPLSSTICFRFFPLAVKLFPLEIMFFPRF